jgi:hypothetical protein
MNLYLHDMAGNVSDISKNIARIVVDNTGSMFNLQPTEVNVNVNAPITTTVYDAQATNLNGGTIVFTDTVISCSASLPATSVAILLVVIMASLTVQEIILR